MLKKSIKILWALWLLLPSINFSCSKENGYIKAEGMIWNTLYHITYKGSPELQDSIIPVLNQVAGSLSVFDNNSLVSLLNQSDSIKADNHLIKVYEKSLFIHRISHGNFDPTVSPLIDAWGFGIGHKPSSDTLRIDSILQFIGIDKTRLQNCYIIKKDPRIQFNFSAIAKGYGCDAVGDMLERNGVTDYMVEIGGEIMLKGQGPSGNKWNIAIDAPREDMNPGEQTALVLNITDKGIATSGNYRNFRKDGSQIRAHTISPVTGYPFLSDVLSATVIAENCMTADAIATACMASDVQGAMDLLNEAKVEGLLIFNDSLWATPGFTHFVLSE